MDSVICPFFDSRKYQYVKQSDYKADPANNILPHQGQDLQGTNAPGIRNAYGVEVLAPCDLEILKPNGHWSYGTHIIATIKSDYNDLIGWKLILGHFNEVRVNEGEKVKKGTILGIQGNTGNCSEINGEKYVHLHVELQDRNNDYRAGRPHLQRFTGVPLTYDLGKAYKNTFVSGGTTPIDPIDPTPIDPPPPTDPLLAAYNAAKNRRDAEYNRWISLMNTERYLRDEKLPGAIKDSEQAQRSCDEAIKLLESV